MKRIFSVFFALLFVVICFSSCNFNTKFKEVNNDFSQLEANKEKYVWSYDGDLFYNHLHILSKDKGEANNAMLLRDGKLYISLAKKNGLFDFSELIYSYDISSGELKLVFEKSNLKTQPISYVEGNRIYYFYCYTITADPASKVCEYYDVITGDSGTDSSDKEFLTLSVNNLGGYFRIYTPTNEAHYIDDEFLSSTEYYDLLKKYNFVADKIFTSNNNVVLSYRAAIDKKINTSYSYAIFEYKIDEKELVFLDLYNTKVLSDNPEYKIFYVE